MDSIRLVTDSERITTVWIDQPAKSVNTLSPATLADLGQALTDIERDQPAGVIFASAKAHGFIAGADLFAIKDAGPEGIESFLKSGQDLFSRIAKLPMPTVAAINGDCLGGGLELSLACRYRVAAEDASIKIGLPEVKLGIVPGWGGTVRLPRTIGLAPALAMMLAGKTLSPKKALRAGLIDDMVRPEALMDAARRWAKQNTPRHQPGLKTRAMGTIPWVRDRIFTAAMKQTNAKSFGHYPAAPRLIEVVRQGYEKGEQAGFDAERRGLAELMKTDACQNLMRIFFLRQAAKRAAAAQINAKPKPVEFAAVVGGGTMGAGIVYALITAGINVRLIEVNPAAVSAGLKRIRKMLDDDVRNGRTTALAAKHTFNRVTPTAEWTGLGLTEFAIEAVLERIEIKREVFAKLEKFTPATAVLASNTSSLSIGDIAQEMKNPGRLIGLHFFNPVPKMPLVEIVASEKSDAQSLATAVGLVGRLGKTPVVVRDAPGFMVNRVLIPYLAEAAMMAKSGASIMAIDHAMKQWGWPMGPFELLDEIGLDIGAEVLKSLAATTPDYKDIPDWMGKIIAKGWLGKKSGRGFYLHQGKGPLLANPELGLLEGSPDLTSTTGAIATDEIHWRLMLPMVNEAARVLDQQIVNSADAIDLGTVMGLGFPPFRGGLCRWADSVGAEEILRRLNEMTQKFGQRFQPDPLWQRLATEHGTFEKLNAKPAPAAVTV